MPRETGIALFIDSRKAKTGAKIFERSLDGVRKTARKTVSAVKRGFNGLRSTFGGLRGALAGVGFGLIVKGLISVNKEFERMRGALVTITGSLENANQEFNALQDFAKSTPFTLDQSVNAFIKLQNLGIKPTEERLASFGNTAAAMGKSLNDFIEAVADASTNEFERLKEFGIKAKQQGDQVELTFQGVTKTIQKDSEAIVGYLEDIGNAQFAGAMENQMKRLPGILSNLQDSFSRLAGAIGEGGFTEAVGKAAMSLSDFITKFIESGRAEDIGIVLGKAFTIAAGAIELATKALANFSLGVRGIGALVSDDPDAFVNLMREVSKRESGPPADQPKIGATLGGQTDAQKEFFAAEARVEAARAAELDRIKERNERVAQTLDDLSNERDDLLKLNDARMNGIDAYKDEEKALEARNIARDLGIDLYSVEGQHIQGLVNELHNLQEELNRPIYRTWFEGLREGFDEFNDYVRDTGGMVKDAFLTNINTMSDTLTDFLTTGELNWQRFADTAVQSINRIFVNKGIIEPFLGIAQGLFSGFGGVQPQTAALSAPTINATPLPAINKISNSSRSNVVNQVINFNGMADNDNGGMKWSARQVGARTATALSET